MLRYIDPPVVAGDAMDEGGNRFIFGVDDLVESVDSEREGVVVVTS